MRTLSFVLLFQIFLGFAAQAQTSVTCVAQGKSFSRNGDRPLLSDSKFQFQLTVDDLGVRHLSHLSGQIQILQNFSDADAKYLGIYSELTLTENTKYRPHRYLGYAQYPDLKASSTEGSQEDGMWGDLVVEKDLGKAHFQAHYILQAGDHLGGTLHFSCQKDQ